MRCDANSIFDCAGFAGGHRCSLRHNVCHPATAAFAIFYKTIRKIDRKSKKQPSHPNTQKICEDNLMRNGCMKCFWSEAY